MTEEERLYLKSQLTKAIDEVVSNATFCVNPLESLQSVTEATRAYVDLDGPLCLSDTEVVDAEEGLCPSGVA